MLLSSLQADPELFILIAALIGLAVGSFLNVVIHRLPIMMENDWRAQCAELLGDECARRVETALTLSRPSSHCPACERPLRWVENIPVLSFLVQRGRCRSCGSGISWRYPGVELLGSALAAVVAAHFGFGWPAMLGILLTWALLALTFIDFDTQYLPDAITLPFLWLGIGVNLFGIFTTLESSVIGAMAGYGSLWSVYQLFKVLTGKEGMGYGDFKLLALLGAWLGWQVLPCVIMLSSIVGSLVGIGVMLNRRVGGELKIPFGPYLASAGWIAMLWGKDISGWYLQIVGMTQ